VSGSLAGRKMDIIKESRAKLRNETMLAIKEALDKSDGFIIHASWFEMDGSEGGVMIKHYNSQRNFLVEDLHTVQDDMNEFLNMPNESSDIQLGGTSKQGHTKK